MLRRMLPNVWIIIPAFNEEQALGSTLKELLLAYKNVVVVDDGSTDGTSRVASQFPVFLIRHRINLGQGAALQTGIDFALRQKADVIVSFDADGQMSASDIPNVCAPILHGEADAVL